ncbi:hypothetical protein Tco_1535054, partial [Tanacetum coccineum]
FWATAKVKTVNGERQLQALVDKKKVIITKTSIRSDLHLEDAGGIDCLPTATIFEELARMGAKTTAWNGLSSTMASAIICLATNQKFNLSKYIFDAMIPITTQPSTSKPQKKQSKRKQTKNTKVPHTSDSTAGVPNKEHVPTHSHDLLLSENKAGLRTHKFKRLYKVGVIRRVASSDDEGLGAQEDASKQRRSRIEAIDRDTEVTLVETQRRNDENDDNLKFDTGVFDGDEIVVETEEPVINVATTTKKIPVSTDEIDLAQALVAMKSAKPKEKDVVQESSENVSTATTIVSTATIIVVATPEITTPPQQRAKGIAFREPVESTATTTVPSQKSKDKSKAIMI